MLNKFVRPTDRETAYVVMRPNGDPLAIHTASVRIASHFAQEFGKGGLNESPLTRARPKTSADLVRTGPNDIGFYS